MKAILKLTLDVPRVEKEKENMVYFGYNIMIKESLFESNCYFVLAHALYKQQPKTVLIF